MINKIEELIIAKAQGIEKEFALQTGIKQQTLNNYTKGKRNIGLDAIIAILSAYPDVSAEWLIRGEGDITKENGLPPMTGEETDSELNLHSEISRLKGQLKAKQDEINSLYGKLNNANATIEYLEGYNERLLSQLNKQEDEQVKKAIV